MKKPFLNCSIFYTLIKILCATEEPAFLSKIKKYIFFRIICNNIVKFNIKIDKCSKVLYNIYKQINL